ncbi:MAG: FtsX-like permease family protein, partial [Gemmataceae bacterium]
FFGSGGMLLTFGLTWLWLWMLKDRHRQVHGEGTAALARLGSRNATRNPVRSLLTAGLLAASAFVVVAVDSFRREPAGDFLDAQTGDGFNLVAESSVSLYQNISTPEGQDAMPFSDPTRDALKGVEIANFRIRRGDDASCLNLYSPGKPRILGVPQAQIDSVPKSQAKRRQPVSLIKGMHFQATAATTPEEKANPWLLLDQKLDDGAIPVFGEANTVMWQLKLLQGVGGTFEIQDETGRPVKLRIVGLLKDSVFQSELLMSEANFLRLYPAQQGFNYFLIAAPPERADKVTQLLQDQLADRGFIVTPAIDKLRGYLAVENTYISTFQALGGLGVLLGALGLAVVLMRSVWERRGELALLRALGYRHSALGWLVFAENAFLLALGVIVGTCAALLAVAPHLVGQGAAPSWLRLLGLLVVVVVVGLTAGGLAVRSALKTPLLPALRKE